jgi:hypothetical protein
MPAHIYFGLIVFVMLAAAGTILLVHALGLSFLWLGLVALLLTLVLRMRKW